LGNMQLLGRLAQAAEFGNRKKRAQQVEVQDVPFCGTQGSPQARLNTAATAAGCKHGAFKRQDFRRGEIRDPER
jgi:hypothetical protein